MEVTGLISIATWLSSKIADKGFDAIHGKLVANNSLNKQFYAAIEVTSNKLQEKYKDILGNSINYFFTKEPVFNELLKLLFKDSKIDSEKIGQHFDNTLPHQFILDFVILLREECLKIPLLNEFLSNKELFILVQGLGSDLRKLVENSSLTLNEIAELKVLLKDKLNNSFNYLSFLEIYYKNASHNLSQVNFLGLGVDIAIKRKRKNLQDVFVKPFFAITNQKFINKLIETNNYDEGVKVTYKDIFKHSTNIVVLGDPGSGKSVLIKSLICDLIESKQSSQKIFPIRLELRKYLSFKKSNGGNILKYLVNVIETEYGISNITIEILVEILSKQLCYIFFDGLDEIFKIEDKLDIKNDIENFHNNFPKIYSLTTSRIIGYEEAKLHDETFCELTVLSFDNDQIVEYLKKWYEKEEENEEIRTREIEGFISKMHEIDRELVSNPLLLSLIVILYRNILKLPESKLEIYQSCTKTLVDKWDASKELDIDIAADVYRNKEKILADLAYWQYQQLSGEDVVVLYEKAKNTVANSIKEKLYRDDIFDCDDLAESFMEYAQKRSIYFDNNFTHKTFLEYYTAYWIYSNIEKKHKISERNDILSKYIGNSFWHIVLELLLIMIDKDQADSEIMDRLFEEQSLKNEALPFLLSTISSFKNIGNKTIINLINRSILVLIDSVESHGVKQIENYHDSTTYQIYESLKNLYFSDQSFKKTITSALAEQETEDSPLLEFVYQMYVELELFNNVDRKTWKLNNYKLFERTTNKNKMLFILSNLFGLDERNYFEKVLVFIDNFGVENMFDRNDTLFENIRIGSYLYYYMNTQVQSANIGKLKSNLKVLEEKGLRKQDIINNIKHHFHYLSEETASSIHDYLASNDIELDILKILLMILIRPERYGSKSTWKHSNKHLTEMLNLKSYEERVRYVENLEYV